MITEQMFVNEVRKVIAERPDYIYVSSTCSYLKCKEECLFGRVLSNLGITQEELIPCESFDIGRALWDFLKDKFDNISSEVKAWSNWIQEKQDTGKTWQDALNSGNKNFPKVLEMYPV